MELSHLNACVSNLGSKTLVPVYRLFHLTVARLTSIYYICAVIIACCLFICRVRGLHMTPISYLNVHRNERPGPCHIFIFFRILFYVFTKQAAAEKYRLLCHNFCFHTHDLDVDHLQEFCYTTSDALDTSIDFSCTTYSTILCCKLL